MTDKYFETEFNRKEVIEKLKCLNKKFSNVKPFLKIIRKSLLNDIDTNFQTEGTSSGEKWKEWSSKYKKLRIKYGAKIKNDKKLLSTKDFKEKQGKFKDKILTLQGHLRKSFTSKIDNNSLIIGTAKEYAAAHNFGYSKRNLPKREFFRFSDETIGDILEEINEFAQEIINNN